jgi:hypothetical protein
MPDDDETLDATVAHLRTVARQMEDTLRQAGEQSAAFMDPGRSLSDQLRLLWAEWLAEWGTAIRKLEDDIAERRTQRADSNLGTTGTE